MLVLLFEILVLSIIGCFSYIVLDSIYYFIISPKGYFEPLLYKESGFFEKLFVDFPHQLGKDLAARDVNTFDAHGLVLFEGKQGAGKTISMVHYANLLKARFPECKVLSNTDLIFQDMHLDNWQPLVTFNNGKKGVVCCIDEISLWANNRNWKNKNNAFNIDMIQTITQNRKNRRVILGTCQSWTMCDKQIRLQTTEIRKAHTWFNCLTTVFVSVPEMDSEGNLLKKRFKRFYWFVQSDFLRECYDTYACISALGNIGFESDTMKGV